MKEAILVVFALLLAGAVLWGGYWIGNALGYESGYGAGYESGVSEGLGHGYNIADPTYQQMLDFIVQDGTDQNEYLEDEYVCRHFATDVCNNAEEEGIRCAYVYVGFPEGSHGIVAFNTTDMGLVYIEPQTDDIMNLEVGQPYWQSGGHFIPPDYDDTVVEILVIW